MAHALLGIDLGTSSVRAGVFDENGCQLGIGTRGYGIDSPVLGYAEQKADVWWTKTCEAIREALGNAGIGGGDISAISYSGQMHGTVLLDQYGDPLVPAIIWADRRSETVLAEITETVGEARMEKILLNRAFPGTQAATLVWIKHNNPPLWRKISRAMTPKDYLRFRMCGLYNSEPSDASATLLFDTGLRDWSREVIDILGIPDGWLPYVVNSDQNVGETEDIEEETGIPDGVPVVMGGGDQPCAALGNGVIGEGALLATVGTGGQLFAPVSSAKASPGLKLTTFCHLPDARWYVMGATLAAGMSLAWFRDTLCEGCDFETLSHKAADVPAGAGGLIYLPWLAGRRSPELDPSAKASFKGLNITHTRGHFVRAVMEGVALELRDNLETMKRMGITINRAVVSGGVVNSPVWMEILAGILQLPLEVSERKEQACYGAALIAGIGCGLYSGWKEAAAAAGSGQQIIEADKGSTNLYSDMFGQYREQIGGK